MRSIPTISDNYIEQWLAFPPYPLPNVVLQVQKNIERKVDIIVATLKEGSGGELSSEGGQRLLAGIVFPIYARNFDGPFSSLSRDRFSKRHNVKQPNVKKPELSLEIISKEMGQIISCRSLEKKENRTDHNSILFGVLHVYTVTHGIGRCTTTLHHRFRAVYPCLDKIF